MPKPYRPSTKGFTLLEIAVVLVIIGIILSFLIPSITARISTARLDATRGKEEIIKTALIAFVAQNKRLPCPAIETLPPTDANYGREATVPGTCTGTTALTAGAMRGIVPWLALGLNDDIALDGYYQRYTYVVTTTQTNLNANTVPGIAGNIAMHSATPVTVANQINVNNLAVVALISHGANTAGAFTPSGTRIAPPLAGADELENTDAANTAFIIKDFSQNAANPFDDVVMAITPTDILNGLEKSGVKTASGSINEKFDSIRNAVIASVVADIVDPDGALLARNKSHRLPAADVNNDGIADGTNVNGTVPYADIGLTLVQVTDPWGNAILYTAGSTALVGGGPPANVGIYLGTAPAGGAAFTIKSRGPNGILGDADDLTFTMSIGELRGILVSNNQMTD